MNATEKKQIQIRNRLILVASHRTRYKRRHRRSHSRKAVGSSTQRNSHSVQLEFWFDPSRTAPNRVPGFVHRRQTHLFVHFYLLKIINKIPIEMKNLNSFPGSRRRVRWQSRWAAVYEILSEFPWSTITFFFFFSRSTERFLKINCWTFPASFHVEMWKESTKLSKWNRAMCALFSFPISFTCCQRCLRPASNYLHSHDVFDVFSNCIFREWLLEFLPARQSQLMVSNLIEICG